MRGCTPFRGAAIYTPLGGRLQFTSPLYAALPRTTAAYLTLCDGRLTAEECYRQAIVNKVVPREKLIATCEEMAQMR